jgi:hypothetical protein
VTRLLLLVASTAVALALGEVVARVLDPEWRLFYPPICFRQDLFEQTPWGYRLHPGRTLRLHPARAGMREELVVSNAEGFRGLRDLGGADTRPRVVVLGDSMVFGVGVAEPERLTERLEAAEPGWRVENLGMIGYGPDLMLRALEAVGLDPPPAAVVMAIYADDPRRLAPLYAGVGFPIPRWVVRDDRLETIPYPRPRPWERLRLVQGLAYARWRYTGAARPVTHAILERWRALGAERGYLPALVFVPRRREGFDDRRWRRWLAGWASAAGVPYLDLTDTLPARGPEIHLPDDPHWSAAGHAAVAEALRPFVAEVLRRRTPAREGADDLARKAPADQEEQRVPDAHEAQHVAELGELHLTQGLHDIPADERAVAEDECDQDARHDARHLAHLVGVEAGHAIDPSP